MKIRPGRGAAELPEENSGGVRFAAAYIRVSTEEQADLSPESQLVEIRKFARRENIVLLNDHIYIDAGISGRSADKRPGFQNMIAAAKMKDCPFSVLLLWKFSRFARNQEESIFYKSILRSKCGIEVISITEPLAAGPFGSLIERIIEWMDEFYSIRLSQEVKRSMTVNARKGKPQTKAPFGYRMEGGRLVPDGQNADHVRWIFDTFLSGTSVRQIAQEMTAAGVIVEKSPPSASTVSYMLHNPVYVGKVRWNPAGRTGRNFDSENLIIADGEHEPLISQETWDMAQHRLALISGIMPHSGHPPENLSTWLSGVVRCSFCGSTLVCRAKTHLTCNGYLRGRCTCSQRIRVDELENAVLDHMEKSLESGQFEWEEVVLPGSSGRGVKFAESAVQNLQNRLVRLKDAYLGGVMELEEYARTKDQLTKDLAAAEEKLRQAQEEHAAGKAAEAMRPVLSSALELLRSDTESIERKNLALRSVISEAVLDRPAGTLKIVYRCVLE